MINLKDVCDVLITDADKITDGCGKSEYINGVLDTVAYINVLIQEEMTKQNNNKDVSVEVKR